MKISPLLSPLLFSLLSYALPRSISSPSLSLLESNTTTAAGTNETTTTTNGPTFESLLTQQITSLQNAYGPAVQVSSIKTTSTRGIGLDPKYFIRIDLLAYNPTTSTILSTFNSAQDATKWSPVKAMVPTDPNTVRPWVWSEAMGPPRKRLSDAFTLVREQCIALFFTKVVLEIIESPATAAEQGKGALQLLYAFYVDPLPGNAWFVRASDGKVFPPTGTGTAAGGSGAVTTGVASS